MASESRYAHQRAGEGKMEYFMLLSLRKTFVIVILALALLAGLFGWSMHMISTPAIYHLTSVHSIHTLAYYCPPPPRGC